jgi:D-alanine-D-alanine ligase
VLELAGVPYVGSTPSACRLAWDKPTAKALAARAGIATPHAAVLPHATFRELGAGRVIEHLVGHLGLPLMVKPARGGSAMGATAVRDAEQLPSAMVTCFSYGEAALVERFVAGTEVAVSVVDTGDGPRALPAVEVQPLSGVYDYAARYTAGATEFFAPARLDGDRAAEVARVALAVHEALGLRDLSRVDLVVGPSDTGDGAVHLLEVNVSPGMTETSLLPMAVDAAGLSFGRLLQELLEQAARRG